MKMDDEKESIEQNAPLVSIGVPVFNSARTIGRTLESLISQDYPNLEIIVSDNCSDDGTYELCRAYAQKDKRIALSQNPTNIGAGDNFLLVCGKASGKYFCWAAGDDHYHPEFVSSLVSDLENRPDAIVNLCRVAFETVSGECLEVVDFAGWKDPYVLSPRKLLYRIIAFATKIKYLRYNLFVSGLWRHEPLKDLDKWYSFTRNMERPLLANMAMKYRFSYVDRELMVKCWHKDSFKSRNPDDPIARAERKSGLWGRYLLIFSLLLRDPLINAPRQYAIIASLAAEMFFKVAAHRVRFWLASLWRSMLAK